MTYIPFLTPISEIIRKKPFSGIFSEANLETVEIPSTDFQKSMNDIRQRLNVKLKEGKYSSVLVHQL